MKPGTYYVITLVDGDVVTGVYLSPERGFYILVSDGIKQPIRSSSIKRVEDSE